MSLKREIFSGKGKEENKENTATTVAETPKTKKADYPTINWLPKKIIVVKPVQAGARWAELLVKGEDKRNEPFMFNKIKRSYQVPLRPATQGGGLHVLLDNSKRYYTPQFPNEALTEQEFFEKLLGTNLNPLLPVAENFWRVDKRSRVTMDKRGLRLDLSNVLDNLKEKILRSNKRKIAPSPELQDTRASYEFMLLDESVQVDKLAEIADLKTSAAIRFAEIAQSEKTMLDFIKVKGGGAPHNADAKWLKGEIYKIVEGDPKLFLSYANDPYYNDKVLIYDAVQLGVLRKVKENQYTSDSGATIGSINDVITYINDPQNEIIKLRVQELKSIKESK